MGVRRQDRLSGWERWRAVEGGGGGPLGEVHGPQCVVVDLNCLGQRLGVPAVTLP